MAITFEKMGNNAVQLTDKDSMGFVSQSYLDREDVAKLVQMMDGGKLITRLSTFLEPDTHLVQAAGVYLKRQHNYQLGDIVRMENWERIWLAESLGWDRKASQAA